MPRRVQKRSRKTRSKKPAKSKQSRGKSTKRTTVGGIIATGVRSLVSVLPGAAFLLPLYDMIFSSVAVDNKKSSSSPFYQDGDYLIGDGIAVYGLCGVVMFNYANILVKAPGSVSRIFDDKDPARPGDIHPTLETSFLDARLVDLVVSVAPDSKSQYRAGRWGVVLIPFRGDHDAETFSRNYVPLSLGAIQEMSGCVSGPSDKPLILRYRPTQYDGRLNSYNQMDSWIGGLIIAYDCDLRVNYHAFSPDEFAPYVTLKGRLEMRTPVVGSDESRNFKDLMWTSNAGLCLTHGNGHKTVLEINDLELKPSEHYKGSSKVKGRRLMPALEQLAME